MLYSCACACVLLVSIRKQKRYYLHTTGKMSFSVTISHQYHVTYNFLYILTCHKCFNTLSCFYYKSQFHLQQLVTEGGVKPKTSRQSLCQHIFRKYCYIEAKMLSEKENCPTSCDSRHGSHIIVLLIPFRLAKISICI